MSRRFDFYGGSPGPPCESGIQLRGDASPYVPHAISRDVSVHPNTGAYGSYSPQVNVSDPVYGAQGVLNPEYLYSHHGRPLNYGSNVDVFYNGNQPYYLPPDSYAMPQHVLHGNQYTEWSSPDYASTSHSPVETQIPENGMVPQQSRPLSGDKNGKSRRFSKRRSVREGDVNNRQRNLQILKPDQSQHTKSEVRFSHQKKSIEETVHELDIPDIPDKSLSKEDENGSKCVDKKEKSQLKSKPDTRSFASKTRKDKQINRSSESQLGVLIEQLTDGTYECMVCCDRVRQQHAIWNCNNCYHVFHMACIKKWARSPSAQAEGDGWRCPGCQHVNTKFPSTYKCYCGKVRQPEWNRHETPHSCGEVCGKKRNNSSCTHACNILCHPGPCPPCPASVIKSCQCRKTSRKVRCSQQKPLTCTEKCGKIKNCGKHRCEVICHPDDCNDCIVKLLQNCFCGKQTRDVFCGSEESQLIFDEDASSVYSCNAKCGRPLKCGNHFCEEVCHPGPCSACPLMPGVLKTCPCTQTLLAEMKDENGVVYKRIQCTDPIPTCGKVCGKPLGCGGDAVHLCQLECHSGPCPPCASNTTTIHCRCGKSEDDVLCSEIPEELYVCDRRCNKKRKCGRHKCGKICCTDSEHNCTQICGRKLECKLHRCEETCHRGNCHSCYNVSFDELSCHCGAEILFPPIPCGTKPPECQRPCARRHSCYHPINHNCHNEEKCPPCVILMKKQCNCGKVMRSNIPCHQTNVSCGAPCKKVLPCGHNCLKLCHPETCQEEGDICTQPCSIMRVECIHPCAMPCHQGKPCPPSKCKAMVTLKCGCGNRQKQVECSESDALFHRLASESLARQYNTVDISGILQSHGGKLRNLACNDECAAIERNRRLAEAFEISDAPVEEDQLFSPFLLNWAEKDLTFVLSVEQELVNLIDAISWLDQTKRTFGFPSMKRDKRQVVHELAEAMKCRSVSIDEEPNRSVVVTATRGVSKIPRVLLSDSVKKKPILNSFNKIVKPDITEEDAVGSSKRLLKSMKLVSMTSVTKPSDSKVDAPPSYRRPASIPKMPSQHSLPASNHPFSSVHSFTSKVPVTSNSGVATSNLAAIAPRSHLNGKDYSASRTTKKPEKEEKEIDYFDMIS